MFLKKVHVDAYFEPGRTGFTGLGFTVYTAPVRTGLLFVSPPKRSDFHSAERTGLVQSTGLVQITTITTQLFKNRNESQGMLGFSLHSLSGSVSELLEYGRLSQ